MCGEAPFEIGEKLVIGELAGHTGSDDPGYRVADLLPGGMGICAKVIHLESGTSYALKVLHRHLLGDQASWKRYLEELKTWLVLSACSGVVEAFCLTRINEVPVVCARWMGGGSLRVLMRSREPQFPYESVARIVGTMDWVNCEHSVIHRDLKPENILLDQEGRAFVCDWGLAKPVSNGISIASRQPSEASSSNVRPDLTQAGSFVGTIHYSSPEQILNAKDVDHRADIYSLGCILFEWETGRPPFVGRGAEEIARKHLFEAVPRLGSSLHRSTFGFDEVIQTCLEKDPANRFQNYSSLAAALAQAADRRGVSISRFSPSVRKAVLPIRHQEPSKYLESKHKADDLLPYLERGQDLIALGDYKGAKEIYDGFFIPELVSGVPDHERNQMITNNYALCLIECGEPEQAIGVLGSIAAAKRKPAEYYITLSLAHLRCRSFAQAEEVAGAGLVAYPDDPDLVGNLLIAQTRQKKFRAAASTARLRLRRNRDVHSLHEVAELHISHAQEILDVDWPLAFESLLFAIGLLREAKEANPQYLPARASLIRALSDITAYSACTEELSAAAGLEWHPSDRVFLARMAAHCLDRSNAHDECVQFCEKWLKNLESANLSKIAEGHLVEIKRTRAITIIDRYCIGKMKDGVRIVEASSLQFFQGVVKDPVHRQPRDFACLAQLYEWMGKLDEAFDLLKSGQNSSPNYWEFPFDRSSFLCRSGRLEDALQDSLRATELAPWKVPTWRLLARIHREIGDEKASREAETRGDSTQAKRDSLDSQFETFWRHS